MAVVQIVFSFGPDDTGTVESLVDEFNQLNPAIRVKYKRMPAETNLYHKRLRNMFMSGSDRIDVIAGDIIWPAEFASKSWIADLSSRFPQSERQLFLDATIEANTYQGKVWGVPWVTDVGLLYYRKDLLQNSGFSNPPKTWDELKTIALQVKQDFGIQDGYVFQGAQYEGGVCNGLEYIWTHGGDVLDSTGAVIINNSAAAKNGLTTERSMVTGSVAPQDVHTYFEAEAEAAFLDGEAVFCRAWPPLFGILDDPDEPLSPAEVGVAELPRASGVGVGGGCLGGWNMFINAGSPHQNEAWQFIAFMTAPAQQRKLAIDAGSLPTRKALYLDPTLLTQVPILGLSRDALNSARPRPRHPCYFEMSEEMAEQFNLSLQGTITPDKAAQTLQTELSNIVANC
jgi:multiple sugar transport system substrate-binding protein